jgi:hypothetical protein
VGSLLMYLQYYCSNLSKWNLSSQSR